MLVVEDEPTIAGIVERYLRRAGYDTRVAADGAQALVSADERRPDLVVLDLMLPEVDGLEVMRRIRARERGRVGFILLTAKGEESDRVIGLRLGADDYLVKPFSPTELVARAEAVLRRIHPAEGGDQEPLAFGALVIDPGARRVTLGGEPAALTQREFDVLLFLARHPGRAFSREQIMDGVWQHGFWSDTSTVTVHVRRLRHKIEEDPARPTRLETVWGVGYRFAP